MNSFSRHEKIELTSTLFGLAIDLHALRAGDALGGHFGQLLLESRAGERLAAQPAAADGAAAEREDRRADRGTPAGSSARSDRASASGRPRDAAAARTRRESAGCSSAGYSADAPGIG